MVIGLYTFRCSMWDWCVYVCVLSDKTHPQELSFLLSLRNSGLSSASFWYMLKEYIVKGVVEEDGTEADTFLPVTKVIVRTERASRCPWGCRDHNDCFTLVLPCECPETVGITMIVAFWYCHVGGLWLCGSQWLYHFGTAMWVSWDCRDHNDCFTLVLSCECSVAVGITMIVLLWYCHVGVLSL